MATGAWNPEKVAVFREQFYEFLNHVQVNSKELGPILLGDHIYQAQRRFFETIFEGLSRDIHDFKHLKSRQLGISTGSRALTLFWNGIHSGLKGYMIFDTDAHKEEARLELIGMVENLPPRLGFPKIKRQNRYLLELSNGSMIMFASAGVRASKGSGTLGRSSGVNFCHGSEMCSWDNVEGLEAFKAALASDFTDRLYIWESTGRGYNQWHDMWMEAKRDPHHQICLFTGWWAKDNQRIDRSHPDFERYGINPPNDEEYRRIEEVREKYGVQITPEQLAWVRRYYNPANEDDDEFSDDTLRLIEQPWTEEDAFQQTGAIFFDPVRLKEQSDKWANNKFKGYTYATSDEFYQTRVYPAQNLRSVQLKVWQEPEEDAVYVVAADPAFGANEHNDRSCIQVLRAYADGLDQVAEYAHPLVNTRQFAWIIASLQGWYAGTTSEVYNILELNGPGEAVYAEMKSLKHHVANGYANAEFQERGLHRIFQNVRDYMYTRTDSYAPGRSLEWKTTLRLKVTILERLRDFSSNGMLRLRSLDAIEEMRTITREGDSIEASGSAKDDRVLALAFAVRCWEDRCRRRLMSLKRTRDFETNKKMLTVQDQVAMFNDSQITAFFAQKQGERRAMSRMANRQRWRR